MGVSWYDYGARFYDPQLGRFHSVDPLASDFSSWTPYHYVHGNPIGYTDPTGMAADWYQDENDELVYNENIKSQSDLDDAGIKGTYVGEEGYGINEDNGMLQHYTADGTINESSLASNDITVRGNPVLAGVHKARKDFANHPVTKATANTMLFVATGGVEGLMALPSLAKGGINMLASRTAANSGRVFWSGGTDAMMAAEGFAKANGLTTLEMTGRGKALTGLTKATSYKLTAPLWSRTSASFARGAKGSVNVFQNANTGVRMNSVWKTTEYPILNGKNNIIYHNVFK